MPNYTAYLNKLKQLKNQIVTFLNYYNVASSTSETLNSLVPKIYNIRNTYRAGGTALQGEIISGKTAYVGGTLITGSYIPVDTSDANATSEDIVSGKTAYVNGVKITGTTAIKNIVNSFIITGTYASISYYDPSKSGYAITPDGNVIIFIKTMSTGYEHIYYFAYSLPDGVTIEDSISAWDTGDPVAIYALIVRGITGKANITVNLDSIVSGGDYVRASITVSYV